MGNSIKNFQAEVENGEADSPLPETRPKIVGKPKIEATPDGFILKLPSRLAVGRVQRLEFPLARADLMHRVLTDWQEAGRAGTKAGIGSPHEPTQAMVREWLKHNKPTRSRPLEPELEALDIEIEIIL